MKKLFLSLVVLLVLVSCKEDANGTAVEEKDTSVAIQSKMVMDVKRDAPADKSYESEPEVPRPTETKIIKNANLRYASEDISNSFLAIQKAVSKYQATISNDASGKDYQENYRNLTIRIPNQHFDSFISDISQGVKHFDTKEISQQDVTEEYVDVESRMRAKKKLEERYLQLLEKANKVSEMLEIEKELAEIREEIEAKEGQLRYLQNRVALSTIHIEIYTSIPSESGATVSYGGKIWNAILSGCNEMSNFLLSLLSIWPLIVIFVGSFFWYRRYKNKKKEE